MDIVSHQHYDIIGIILCTLSGRGGKDVGGVILVERIHKQARKGRGRGGERGVGKGAAQMPRFSSSVH